MKYVFVVSPTLKDADGVLGLIYAMSHSRIAPESLTITYIQPLYKDSVERDSFHDLYMKFRDSIPQECVYKVTHCTVAVSNLPNEIETWATSTAAIIEEHGGPACIFLDLGTAYENKEITALYRILRETGMGDKCILYAPSPDSNACAQWKQVNNCNDFVVRRENVTRARAIYVPMRTRFCEALGIPESIIE